MSRGVNDNPGVHAARARAETGKAEKARYQAEHPNDAQPYEPENAETLTSYLAVTATQALGHTGSPRAKAALTAFIRQPSAAFPEAQQEAKNALVVCEQAQTREGHERLHQQR
jgi:hypothetical protein